MDILDVCFCYKILFAFANVSSVVLFCFTLKIKVTTDILKPPLAGLRTLLSNMSNALVVTLGLGLGLAPNPNPNPSCQSYSPG